MRISVMILLLALSTACGRSTTWEGSLESMLASQADRFGIVLQNPEKFRVQIIYTQIDRDADNRLYEFLGQQELNESLKKKGYRDTRIIHRLEVALDMNQNQWTNPIQFIKGNVLIHEQGAVRSAVNYYKNTPELLGVAEIVNGEILHRPKDFSKKNAYPLLDQHGVIKNLMFPQIGATRHMRDIRQSMLRGDWPAACKRCNLAEETGARSRRQVENQHFGRHIPWIIENTDEQGFSTGITVHG